jgi:uncharacterized protein YceK
MARAITAAAAAILATAALSGCGTAFDTFRMSPYGQTCRVYGGVRVDAKQAHDRLARAFGPRSDARFLDLVGACGCVGDMPLSAVADTLLLPMTLPRAQHTTADSAQPRDTPTTPATGGPAPGAAGPQPAP